MDKFKPCYINHFASCYHQMQDPKNASLKKAIQETWRKKLHEAFNSIGVSESASTLATKLVLFEIECRLDRNLFKKKKRDHFDKAKLYTNIREVGNAFPLVPGIKTNKVERRIRYSQQMEKKYGTKQQYKFIPSNTEEFELDMKNARFCIDNGKRGM